MWTMFNPSCFSPGELLMEAHREQPESNALWDHGRMGEIWDLLQQPPFSGNTFKHFVIGVLQKKKKHVQCLPKARSPQHGLEGLLARPLLTSPTSSHLCPFLWTASRTQLQSSTRPCPLHFQGLLTLSFLSGLASLPPPPFFLSSSSTNELSHYHIWGPSLHPHKYGLVTPVSFSPPTLIVPPCNDVTR